MLSIFCCNVFGFLITPKPQSSMMFEFSVKNGYPLSKERRTLVPPILAIFLITILLASGCTSTGIDLLKLFTKQKQMESLKF